ncbi:MAG: GTPase HflX [Actinobacteria bacterium]|nr:GTPase HflX [Actinomycetota bacterium]
MADSFDSDAAVEAEIEERSALRRVSGLSTELTDVTEVEYRQVRLEQVILIGVWTSGSAEQAERSLAELARLAETAGSVVLDGFVQRRDKPDAGTFIGSGKARELRDMVVALGADTVICDGELSPGQLTSLEKVVHVKVVDRTWLILDIFSQHSRSREGKTQVALAQMNYMLPRLRGWGDAMSRQSGGIGARRGPGETKIETDRRRVRAQISKLRRDLKQMTKTRETARASRRRSNTPSVAIVGYTNAGKSSLLNRLTQAGVLVQDELFATVDPTVRKARTPSGREITLSDTVGFVRHLPHQLIESFRSTLEEASEADLLLHVVDGADAAPLEQIAAVREVLAEVGADNIPELIAVNKSDVADPAVLEDLRRDLRHVVFVSALTGDGFTELMEALERDLPTPAVEVDVLLGYEHADLVAQVHREGEIESIEHGDSGTRLRARVDEQLAARLQEAATRDA